MKLSKISLNSKENLISRIISLYRRIISLYHGITLGDHFASSQKSPPPFEKKNHWILSICQWHILWLDLEAYHTEKKTNVQYECYINIVFGVIFDKNFVLLCFLISKISQRSFSSVSKRFRQQNWQSSKLTDIGTRKIFDEDHDIFREQARKFFAAVPKERLAK